LSHMHGHRVVHRYVNSDSILIGGRGQAMLTDFRLAACIDDAAAMQTNVGMPGFAAPEVIDGLPYGLAVDTFAAGVILYFALSWQLPFHGPDQETILRRTSRCEPRYSQSKFGHLRGRVHARVGQKCV
ncbi:unnamed protein product, partial [Polarella glacialis]